MHHHYVTVYVQPNWYRYSTCADAAVATSAVAAKKMFFIQEGDERI